MCSHSASVTGITDSPKFRDAESIAGELVSRVRADHRLESVRIARPSLDDVFLHHTGRALRE